MAIITYHMRCEWIYRFQQSVKRVTTLIEIFSNKHHISTLLPNFLADFIDVVQYHR